MTHECVFLLSIITMIGPFIHNINSRFILEISHIILVFTFGIHILQANVTSYTAVAIKLSGSTSPFLYSNILFPLVNIIGSQMK